MKKFTLAGFVVVIFAFSAFGQKAAAAKVDPAKGVRDAFERLVEGIKEVDVEKVMSVYDNSDRTLFFNDNGSATMGWKNMNQMRKERYEKTENVSLEVTGLRVEMLSKTSAYVSFKWKQSQEFDGKLESASGRTTLIFKMNGKEWKILHAHTSPDNPPATRPVLESEREKPGS